MEFETPTLGQRLRRLVGSTVEHDLRPYQERVHAISEAVRALEGASDHELRRRAAALRGRAAAGETLDELCVETFALVRVAAWRVLGQRPYDEQVIAGLAMAGGRLAEMQTGEGKTLAAVAPAALHALGGQGVHVLTFNDYLARRDAAWMGPVYELLGLSVGHVQEGMDLAARRLGYGCDVTYVTAKEAGFDSLRGFLVLEPEELVHRPFSFAIVDEADSILVDEARVPLVIAGEHGGGGHGLARLARLVRRLEPGVDFDTDEHARNVNLTEAGCERVEALLGCGNLFAAENLRLLAEVRNALHAEVLLSRDVDYIVRNARVELVDELTGRVVEDRQWPDGLQSAIEAKEGLEAQPEGRILGSITMQHFIRQYPGLAGMTATAQGSAAELEELYGLQVTVVPTHSPCRRVDHPDLVFAHRQAKEEALVEEIASVHAGGRPILVGTASVEESEQLAAALAGRQVPCRVLNARNDEEEAAIVAEAGDLGAVTISTNMAGRGTDIRLGGGSGANHDAVAALGGLYVIGTNRHESRRIDDQLRGRAGRQGDPGSSRFFISLEDPLMQRFGLAERLAGTDLGHRDGPLDDAVVSTEIARTQRMVDGQNFEARKTLSRYAEVVEAQRQYVAGWRQEVLHGTTLPEVLAERCPARYQEALEIAGTDELVAVERRLTLLMIDRCWADYLAEMAHVRDGIHLVSLAGKQPYEEFHAAAREAFDDLLGRIDDEVAATFEMLTITAGGVDWEAEGLLGPSSTWTYLVTDRPFEQGPLAAMAGRQSIGIYLALAYSPFWIAWAFYCRLRRLFKRPVAG